MTVGGQCSDNLESFSSLFRSQRVVCSGSGWLVTVANLSGASIGEVSLVAGVENLIAELELALLQAVDVLLQLGQLGVESLLLGREGDLEVRNIFSLAGPWLAGWVVTGQAGDKKCPLRLIINSVKHNQVVLVSAAHPD